MNSIFSEENLHTFSVVARLTNFSRAAAELGITTSAVSYAIKRMENYLGSPLFIRTTRNVELTESGEYFYRKTLNLLDEFRAIERSVSSIDQGIEARLRICINKLLYTPYHTATLLRHLKQRFPSCQVIIMTEVYNGVWDALLNKNADIAIGAPDTLMGGGGIDYAKLGHIHWEFAIPPHHPLALLPEPIAESQLRIYPTIMVEDTAYDISKKVGWLLHGQEAIQVPDFETKCQSQILGTGIGFLPDYLIRPYVENGQLIIRKIQNPRQPSEMLLASRHSIKGLVTQWIKRGFMKNGVLFELYKDLLHE